MAKINKQLSQEKIKAHHKWRNFFFGFLIILTFVYLGCGYLYDHFYPNTTVLGAELKGVDKTDARMILEAKENKILAKKIVVMNNGKPISATLGQIGFYYDLDGELAQIYSWSSLSGEFKNLFCQSCGVMPFAASLNSQKLNNFLNQQVVKAASDPTLPQVYVENGVVQVKPGNPGQKPDLLDLQKQISNLNPESSQAFIFDLKFQETPATAVDAPYILNAEQKIDQLISRQIVFKFQNQTFTADKATIGGWLDIETQTDQVKYSFDTTKMWAYVSYLNDQVTIAPQDRIINYKGDKISDGADGRALDQNNAYADLQAGLSQIYAEFDLVTVVVPRGQTQQLPDNGPSPGMYPGKYIEVDLSQQMLYLIDGNNIQGSYQISSGAYDTPTPTGTFFTMDKMPLAWSTIGGVWMPWWMQVTDSGVGIHELPYWPDGTREGSGNLGWAVSHGCMRLGIGPAETVYNWTPVGTTVVIHN